MNTVPRVDKTPHANAVARRVCCGIDDVVWSMIDSRPSRSGFLELFPGLPHIVCSSLEGVFAGLNKVKGKWLKATLSVIGLFRGAKGRVLERDLHDRVRVAYALTTTTTDNTFHIQQSGKNLQNWQKILHQISNP